LGKPNAVVSAEATSKRCNGLAWRFPRGLRAKANAQECSRSIAESAFLSLAHHIDMESLREAFRRTRKDGAAGVDGQTGKDYEEWLEENLQSLLEGFKSGRYKAPPVRRTYVPKGDGKRERPIGMPTFEDKVLQRAVTMVLEAVYEQDSLPCSYGYRPGRSAHHAGPPTWLLEGVEGAPSLRR
jgi:RNA-directed DNA polymerase